MQLDYTDTNLWEDRETGYQFAWNGHKTVRVYDAAERQVDVITLMHQPTRAEVAAAIGRRVRGE